MLEQFYGGYDAGVGQWSGSTAPVCRFSNSRPVKQGVTSLPPGVSDDASLQPGATAIDEPGSTIIIEPGA